MNINHICISESVVWQEGCDFKSALWHLSDIFEYISAFERKESIFYNEDIFDQYILENCTVAQCFYCEEDDELGEEKRLLAELIGRMSGYEEIAEPSSNIGIEFYPLPEEKKPCFRSICGLKDYLKQRRLILAELVSPLEFSTFMPTCFANSVFSDNILIGLKKIPDFDEMLVRKSIVEDLSVLNDYALEIYNEYYPDFKAMYQALDAKVLSAGPDPKHKKKLEFAFTYTDGDDTQTKMICCSPHTKLLRKNSNLRIYFYWKDDDVAPNKVLIGHIGGHPY